MKLEVNVFKMFKGYRTFIAAGFTIIFGTLSLVDWNSFFNDPKAGITAISTALLFAVMRYFTSTPPGEAVHPDTKIVEKLPEIIEKLPEPPKEAIKEEIKEDIEEVKK